MKNGEIDSWRGKKTKGDIAKELKTERALGVSGITQ